MLYTCTFFNKNKTTVQSQQRGNYNQLVFAELS